MDLSLDFYEQTTDPTPAEDFAAGYYVFNQWLNTDTNQLWVCLDDGVWFNITSTDITGDVTFDGNVTFNGAIAFGPAITIAINSNTDNLSIPGVSSGLLIRLNSSGNYNLTGIIPPSTDSGWWLIVSNVGTGNISLRNNNARSDPENRFLFGANKKVQPNEGLAIVYDTVDLRWRSFGIQI